VVCNKGGGCVNGVCACAPGYEGIQCNDLTTSKFTGNFSCVQHCGSDSTTYTLTISATGPISGSNITFYSLQGFDIVAVVSGYGINIQSQILQTGQKVNGGGQISSDLKTITLNMTIIPQGSTIGNTCAYTLTRI